MKRLKQQQHLVIKIRLDLFDKTTRDKIQEATDKLQYAPKNDVAKSMVEAYINTALTTRTWIIERFVTDLRKIYPTAPSRQTIIKMRQLKLLQGCYKTESYRGKNVNYYDIDKLIKRLALLEPTGWITSMETRREIIRKNQRKQYIHSEEIIPESVSDTII